MVSGSTIYSPAFESGDNFVTASGNTLAYTTNSTGAYLFGDGGLAKFIRTDIPVQNGVLHVSPLSYRSHSADWSIAH